MIVSNDFGDDALIVFFLHSDLFDMQILRFKGQPGPKLQTLFIHLPQLSRQSIWIAFGYREPYIFFDRLPSGLFYIINSPPDLGREAIIETLTLSQDILVQEKDQLWCSLDSKFPYVKSSLILSLSLGARHFHELSVSTRVLSGIEHFVVKYCGFLDENILRTLRKQTDWKLAIPMLMV